jgi:hypothetical protein
MTKITLQIQESVAVPQESEMENSAPIDKVSAENDDLAEEASKPVGISIKIVQKDLMSDEESKLGCMGVKSSVLGKRAVRKWEKRWVLQPNVFDLNEGEIWVQKWV